MFWVAKWWRRRNFVLYERILDELASFLCDRIGTIGFVKAIQEAELYKFTNIASMIATNLNRVKLSDFWLKEVFETRV